MSHPLDERTWHRMTEEIMAGMREWRLQHPKATLREIEHELDTRWARVRARMLEDLALASAAANWAATPAGQQPTCPDCGQPLHLRGADTRTLQTQGGRHTESDAFLHLPAERLIFTGDLLVVKNHPDLTVGHPHHWLTILAKIKALDPICLIPGHGDLGTLAEVGAIERYINDLLRLAEENARQSGPAKSAVALQPPSLTAGWNNADAFGRNMKFLHEVVRQ